jgi:hypothetical protein
MAKKKKPAAKRKTHFKAVSLDEVKKVIAPKNIIVERKTEPYSVQLDARSV